MSCPEKAVPIDSDRESVAERAGLADGEPKITQLKRRIDLKLLPWIFVTFLILRIDYTNVTYAAIMNIEQKHNIKQQLHLSPSRWNWVISCFYYPYLVLEPFFPLVMRAMTPKLYFAIMAIVWGGLVCCIGAIQNYGQLIAIRILESIAQAGWFPCVIYYLTFWFRPEELTRRIAFVSSANQISAMISGFLAYAISFADGHWAGWRWLFVIEGTPAILIGILALNVLPNYPQTADFLSEEEKSTVLQHVAERTPSQNKETLDRAQVIKLFRDPTFWTFPCIWFFQSVGGFGLSFVLPTVIFQLGMTTSALSNVLAIPPAFCALVCLNVFSYLVQSRGWNPYHTTIALVTANIIAYIVILTVEHPVFRYLSLVAATAATGSVQAILWSSRVKSASGITGRAIAIGWTAAFNQFSGILGPMIFSTTYGPKYTVSFLICLVLLIFAIASIALTGHFTGELWTRSKTREIGSIKPQV